ncbi:MAG: ribonuclease H-like domain-containing protein, partial [Candidatus Sumerlaeota bacterium]|nr:ribonuclease H-like domain-containing protein [Candidatus Sumerlaeota bacterium]
MRDLDEEPSLVAALRRRMADFEAIVSYNGRSFDVPLLRTRFVFHRAPSVWERPHLDLLPLARRLWRGRLPDCSLSTVERSILGIRRLSDVPSALVPQIYFDFLRGMRVERMIPVFDHHAQDIVSLGALLGRLGRLVEEPRHPDFAHAADQLGLAGLFEGTGRPDQAFACLREALRLAEEPETVHRVALRLAHACKRRGRWEEARAIWTERIENGPPGRVEAHVELAKYYEHQAREHEAAMEVVHRAIRALDARREVEAYLALPEGAGSVGVMDELLHRLRRLQARRKGKMGTP